MPVSGTGPATGSPNRVSNRAPATARRNPASPTGTKPGRTWSPSQTTPTAAGTAVSPTTTAAVVTVTAPRCRPVAKKRKAISAPPTNAYVAGSAIRRPGANPEHAGRDRDHAEPEPGHRPQYRRPRRVGQPSGREPGHAQHEHAGRQDEPGGAVRFVVALRAGGDREQGEAEAHHRHGGPVPR